MAGLTVEDPFAGGGSTLVESSRLGARAIGTEVDPLAVEIVRHELDPADAAAVKEAASDLLAILAKELGWLYAAPDPDWTPLHYFFLREVSCRTCGHSGRLYRNLIIARSLGKSGSVVRDHPITAFCPDCLAIHHLKRRDQKRIRCCNRHDLTTSTYSAQRYQCPVCSEKWYHADLKTGAAPRRLIAVEETHNTKHRKIRAPERSELLALSRADRLLDQTDNELRELPKGNIPTRRRDPRPRSYGITSYQQLFTSRQLAVFNRAFRWLRTADLDRSIRRGMELALSNALSSNNHLCGYATDYGRLSPLFTIRGYSLPALSVELNPLHQTAGRGTLARSVQRVCRSASPRIRRHIWTSNGPSPSQMSFSRGSNGNRVVCGSALLQSSLGEIKTDLALFDPPFFDYIAYSELSAFFRAWWPGSRLAGAPLLPNEADPVGSFSAGFAEALRSTTSRLRSGRLLAFTFHSSAPAAWTAVATALDEAKLSLTAIWPVLNDIKTGMTAHSHDGNCEWDIVCVARRTIECVPTPFPAELSHWITKVSPRHVGDADKENMKAALAIAATRFARPQK